MEIFWEDRNGDFRHLWLKLIEDNGRPLILNDFKSKMLPSHPTIQNRFGITLKKLCDTYYPLPQEDACTRQFDNERLRQKIREDILSCGIYTKDEYDKVRDKRLPCTTTILKRFNFRTWGEFLEYIDIQPVKVKHKRGSSIREVIFRFKYEDRLHDRDYPKFCVNLCCGVK